MMDKSSLLRVFSLAFECPDESLAGLLVSGVFGHEVSAVCTVVGLPEAVVGSASEKLAGYCYRYNEDVMHELRQEYTRLFLGQYPKVSHSEGLWRCRAEGYKNPPLMVNPRSLDVQRFQQACGVVRAEGYADCVDTVSVECDFAAYLAEAPEFPEELGKTSAEAYTEFLDSHMKQWIPGFCQDVRAASDDPYYNSMVDLLEEFIAVA
jgi:putative dimethyl sulfoxide reductase chaperone